MTTILYKKSTMFSDSRGYSGSNAPIGSKPKLFKLPCGAIFGGSSTIRGAVTQLRLYAIKYGWKDVCYDDSIKADGLIYSDEGLFFFSCGICWSQVDENKPVAVGSGAEYVLGALRAGAAPEEALCIACELDVWSELPVQEMSYEFK